MKEIFITLCLLMLSVAAFSQTTETLTRKVILGDTVVIRTITIVNKVSTDTMSKKEVRDRLDVVNLMIQNNNESKRLQNLEFDRLDAIYQAEKLRLKAELAK